MNNYEERLPGEAITLKCRKEAYEQVDKETLRNQIVSIMKEKKEPMSVKEVSIEMFKRHLIPNDERQACAPRMTELSQMGIIEPCGSKKRCPYSKIKVSVYRLREQS